MVSQFNSLGYTIMGKTADLTVVQKTIIDTLHKEGKPQTLIELHEEFGYSCHQRRLNWSKEKKNWTVAQWSKVLFSVESKFCISFGNQGPRARRKGGEAHSPSCLKSSVKFPQSVMIWEQCHLLVLVHCVFWKPTSLHPFTNKFWSISCFLLLTSFLKMLISFSSRIWHLPKLTKAPKVG